MHILFRLLQKVGPELCGSDHFPILLENDDPPSLESVQRWKLAKANFDKFQHLCSTRLHQSAIADACDPMSLFTSKLKDIAEETIPKTSTVPKRFNKPWFSDSCKDAIKERNRALERFKREPTEGNLNSYRIARAKNMERMINRRLVWYLESHKLLTNVQCGFRSRRSTIGHLVRFETFCMEAFIHNQHLVSVFFDLKKTYDTTLKYGIMKDLRGFGLRGRLPNFISNLLKNRCFKVRVGSTFSDSHTRDGCTSG